MLMTSSSTSSPTTTITEALFEAALSYNIEGTATNDTITGGALADTIDAAAGADTIAIGAGANVVQYNATDDGGEAGAEESTLAGFDVITGFTTGTDHIDYNPTVTATAVVAGTVGDNDDVCEH